MKEEETPVASIVESATHHGSLQPPGDRKRDDRKCQQPPTDLERSQSDERGLPGPRVTLGPAECRRSGNERHPGDGREEHSGNVARGNELGAHREQVGAGERRLEQQNGDLPLRRAGHPTKMPRSVLSLQARREIPLDAIRRIE